MPQTTIALVFITHLAFALWPSPSHAKQQQNFHTMPVKELLCYLAPPEILGPLHNKEPKRITQECRRMKQWPQFDTFWKRYEELKKELWKIDQLRRHWGYVATFHPRRNFAAQSDLLKEEKLWIAWGCHSSSQAQSCLLAALRTKLKRQLRRRTKESLHQSVIYALLGETYWLESYARRGKIRPAVLRTLLQRAQALFLRARRRGHYDVLSAARLADASHQLAVKHPTLKRIQRSTKYHLTLIEELLRTRHARFLPSASISRFSRSLGPLLHLINLCNENRTLIQNLLKLFTRILPTQTKEALYLRSRLWSTLHLQQELVSHFQWLRQRVHNDKKILPTQRKNLLLYIDAWYKQLYKSELSSQLGTLKLGQFAPKQLRARAMLLLADLHQQDFSMLRVWLKRARKNRKIQNIQLKIQEAASRKTAQKVRHLQQDALRQLRDPSECVFHGYRHIAYLTMHVKLSGKADQLKSEIFRIASYLLQATDPGFRKKVKAHPLPRHQPACYTRLPLWKVTPAHARKLLPHIRLAWGVNAQYLLGRALTTKQMSKMKNMLSMMLHAPFYWFEQLTVLMDGLKAYTKEANRRRPKEQGLAHAQIARYMSRIKAACLGLGATRWRSCPVMQECANKSTMDVLTELNRLALRVPPATPMTHTELQQHRKRILQEFRKRGCPPTVAYDPPQVPLAKATLSPPLLPAMSKPNGLLDLTTQSRYRLNELFLLGSYDTLHKVQRACHSPKVFCKASQRWPLERALFADHQQLWQQWRERALLMPKKRDKAENLYNYGLFKEPNKLKQQLVRIRAGEWKHRFAAHLLLIGDAYAMLGLSSLLHRHRHQAERLSNWIKQLMHHSHKNRGLQRLQQHIKARRGERSPQHSSHTVSFSVHLYSGAIHDLPAPSQVQMLPPTQISHSRTAYHTLWLTNLIWQQLFTIIRKRVRDGFLTRTFFFHLDLPTSTVGYRLTKRVSLPKARPKLTVVANHNAKRPHPHNCHRLIVHQARIYREPCFRSLPVKRSPSP